jgi:hypothetical protein
MKTAAVIVLLLATRVLATETALPHNFGIVQLLPGYSYQPGEGADSIVGAFTRGDFTINFDFGAMAGVYTKTTRENHAEDERFTVIRSEARLIDFLAIALSFQAAAGDFSLSCSVAKNAVHCILRNETTKPLRYSDYTIGYHEACLLERYDSASASWIRVDLRNPNTLRYASAGASQRNVKTVAPGAMVSPTRVLPGLTPSDSFSLDLGQYALPADSMSRLRVTQIMGTMTQTDLSVWKGRVSSKVFDYKPTP